LHCGDKSFKDTSLNRSLTIDELPQRIIVENNVFEITIVSQVDGHIDTLPDGSRV